MKTIFVCSYSECGKTYVNSSIFKRHIQACHSSSKRFQCSNCGKCLASGQNLKEHMFIHTRQKPYVCPYPACGASFRQGTHLSSHKKLEHSDEDLDFLGFQQYITNAKILRRRRSDSKNQRSEDNPNQSLRLPSITGPYQCKLPNIFASEEATI